MFVLRLYSQLPYDASRTIAITGSPRSGTTWLAGLVNSIPGSSILFEPLHLDRVPEAREAGFKWRTFVPPGTDWEEGERFLAKVFRGQVLNRSTTREVGHIGRTSTWIVKFVRANRMLGWIIERFPIRRPILLLRHPCAVVASTLRQNWWETIGPPPEEEFIARRPEFADVMAKLRTPEEFVAAIWAIDTFEPLHLPRPHGWEILFYEEVVKDCEGHMLRIFDAWGLDMPSDLAARAAIVSSTTGPGSKAEPRDPITRWRGDLTREQAERVLAVAHAFGLDFYGDDPYPDLARLARFAGD